jgi:hypothetical protein
MDAVGNKTGAAKEAFDVLEKSLVRGADATSFWGGNGRNIVSDFEIGLDVLGRSAYRGRADELASSANAQQRAGCGDECFVLVLLRRNVQRAGSRSPDLIAANAETAKALDAESRGLALVKFRQKEVAEAIRKGTEAHQLDLAAIHAHTAEEQAGVAMTRTYLELRLNKQKTTRSPELPRLRPARRF